MSWTPNCKAGGLNLHCLCVAGYISTLISARMQHSDENVGRLVQVIFGEKASWWTRGQLERWQAHQVGASHNFAQVVQAYTGHAQAYLYNTYTSNLYTHIMEARLVGASYNLSYCKHTQVAQPHAVQENGK